MIIILRVIIIILVTLLLQKEMKRILFLTLIITHTIAFSQQTIKGKIIDTLTKEPLEMAVIKDSATGAIVVSDKGGYFTFNNTKDNTFIISLIEYSGYTLHTSSPKDNYIIPLQRAVVNLNNITITNQRNIISTNRALSMLDLNDHPAKSAQDLLRMVPGVLISQHNGGGERQSRYLSEDLTATMVPILICR